MADINFGLNILPKANNTYTLGNSSYKWNIYANTINGTSVESIINGNSGSSLPSTSSAYNGYVLGTVNGSWAKMKIKSDYINKPDYIANGMISDISVQPIVSELRANRLAFLPASQIIIEKTTDGGVTWEDAEVSDEDKTKLFSELRPNIYLPLVNGERSFLGQLRITFTAKRYDVPENTSETEKYNYWNSTYALGNERYCQLREFYFWLNSSADRLNIKIERAKGTNTSNWEVAFENTDALFSGWSGNDYISMSNSNAWGGNQSYYWNYRITLSPAYNPGESQFNQTYIGSRQGIGEIRAYGPCMWDKPNEYAFSDHLYSFDYQQNAIFPGTVKATNFLVGNNTLPTDIQLNGTSVVSNGVANIPTGYWNRLGVVKPNPDYGCGVDGTGTLCLSHATDAQIKAGTNTYKPIVPSVQHQSIFYGLAKVAGDVTQASSNNTVGTYTTEAQGAIKTMLGIAEVPAVTSADDGKVLRVVNGEWSAVSLPSVSGVSW